MAAVSDQQRGRGPSVRLGVITVWYEGECEIDRFAQDRRAMARPDFTHIHIVNAMSQDGLARLRSAMTDAIIKVTEENIGPAAAWNLGIDLLLQQGVEYVAIWNPDVQLDPGCLQKLLDVLDGDPGIGAVGPVLLFSNASETVQMYGGTIDPQTGVADHDYRGVTDLSGLPSMRDASYLDGGTMMIRGDLFKHIGKFDERVFMYGEDSDFSLRVRAAGYRTVAVRDARARHFIQERRGMVQPPYQLFYETRNNFYLVRKHGGKASLYRYIARMCLGLPRKMISFLRRRQGDQARAYLLGVINGIAGFTGKQGWVN